LQQRRERRPFQAQRGVGLLAADLVGVGRSHQPDQLPLAVVADQHPALVGLEVEQLRSEGLGSEVASR
jgi:hypothetical protein